MIIKYDHNVQIVCTSRIIIVQSLMYKRFVPPSTLLVSHSIEDDHRLPEPDHFLEKKR